MTTVGGGHDAVAEDVTGNPGAGEGVAPVQKLLLAQQKGFVPAFAKPGICVAPAIERAPVERGARRRIADRAGLLEFALEGDAAAQVGAPARFADPRRGPVILGDVLRRAVLGSSLFVPI